MSQRDCWLVVVQDEEGQETELVTTDGVTVEEGATIETTDGRRITFTERAQPEAA